MQLLRTIYRNINTSELEIVTYESNATKKTENVKSETETR